MRGDKSVVCANCDVEKPHVLVESGSEGGVELSEFYGVDRVIRMRAAQPGHVGRHRNRDEGAWKKRVTATESAIPRELIEVMQRSVQSLGATARKAGDGAAVAIWFRAIGSVDERDNIFHQAFREEQNCRSAFAVIRIANDGNKTWRCDLVLVGIWHDHDHRADLALRDQVVEDLRSVSKLIPIVFIAATAVEKIENRVAVCVGFVARRRVDPQATTHSQA